MATGLFNGLPTVTVPYMQVGFAHEVPKNCWSDELLADLVAGVQEDLRREWPRVVALADALLPRRELSGQEATMVIDDGMWLTRSRNAGGRKGRHFVPNIKLDFLNLV